MFYGGTFYVAVIWGLPPPLLLGVHTVCEAADTYHSLAYTLQRGPLSRGTNRTGCMLLVLVL